MRRLEQISRMPRRVERLQRHAATNKSGTGGTSADGRRPTFAPDSGRGYGRSAFSISDIGAVSA
jgi:hypothetical protein